MSNTDIFLLTIGILAFLIGLMLAPIRAIFGAIWSQVINPISVGILTMMALWLMYLAKRTIRAHLDWLRNLAMPRTVLLPSLEDEDDWKL